MEFVIDYINSDPEQIKSVNAMYRNMRLNEVLAAVFSVGATLSLILGITAIRKRSALPPAQRVAVATPALIGCIGFIAAIVALVADRTALYQTWTMT